VQAPGLAGVRFRGRGQNVFPTVTGRAAGNQLPGITGDLGPGFRPAPGYWHVDGQLGAYDGNIGDDPRLSGRKRLEPYPKSPDTPAWGEGDVSGPGGKGAPPIPYGGSGARGGWAGRNGFYGAVSDTGPRQSWWRGGIQGFSDKLTVKDRHAYWDTGYQRTGNTGFAPSGSPNTYNDPMMQPPAPELRTVNRTVSYQKGSDKTRNQDDLTRPYTWLGEQGLPWTPVSGGVPGLYQPYGTRGGIPYPIVSPVEQGAPGDGPRLVSPGPPHGLHSQTPWKGGEQLIKRYETTPQMRPVRIDRPSNSPQAGQSYSQTVRPQGQSGIRPRGPLSARAGGAATFQGRGFIGRSRKGWIQ
jgi:hypothetical protein